jgi:hypothetical protein
MAKKQRDRFSQLTEIIAIVAFFGFTALIAASNLNNLINQNKLYLFFAMSGAASFIVTAVLFILKQRKAVVATFLILTIIEGGIGLMMWSWHSGRIELVRPIPARQEHTSPLNIRVAGVWMEESDVTYRDCVKRVEGRDDFLRKWQECGAVEKSKTRYFSFVYLENRDAKPVFDLRTCLIATDGAKRAHGNFKLRFPLDGQQKVILEQRQVLTEWSPQKYAVCVSGRYDNSPPTWSLYIGKPWYCQLVDSIDIKSYYEIPQYWFVKSGQGDSFDECIKYAEQEISNVKEENR